MVHGTFLTGLEEADVDWSSLYLKFYVEISMKKTD